MGAGLQSAGHDWKEREGGKSMITEGGKDTQEGGSGFFLKKDGGGRGFSALSQRKGNFCLQKEKEGHHEKKA